LNFELRAWTDQYEDWGRIRSDLALAINTALIKENLAA
jgi:small-conductance mechanosensitive channel